MSENYAIALDSCYLFSEKNAESGIEHDVDNANGFTGEINFSQDLMAPEYWGTKQDNGFKRARLF